MVKNLRKKILTATLVAVVAVIMLITGIVMHVAETKSVIEGYDCDEWNGTQCLDEESKWFGCDVEKKMCYDYCLDGGVCYEE